LFWQKLTPELVIKEGYYSYDMNSNLFPEKIKGEIYYEISKDDVYKNIQTFTATNIPFYFLALIFNILVSKI